MLCINWLYQGKLPSIPSAETIESEGQQDDKEVVDFFANSDNMGRSTPGNQFLNTKFADVCHSRQNFWEVS